MNRLLLITCALTLVAFNDALGQSSTMFSVPEGLPSSEVYQVFQDRRGFIWFCTDNGVARFDGRKMELFHVKDGLVDPVIFGITEDYKGRLWFRSYSGKVAYFENERIYAYQYNQTLGKLSRNSLMSSLFCDSTDKVWFGMGPYLGSIDNNGNVDTTKVSSYTFSSIDVDGNPLHAFSGPTYLIKNFLFKGENYSIAKTDSMFRYHVLCVARWNGKLYLTNNNHIFEFDDSHARLVKICKSPIISMSVDNNNSLWIGYMNNGAERYTHDLANPDLELYRERSISSVTEDHEGGIWLSTLENGVIYVPNWKIKTFTPANYNNVKAIVADGNQIVIGDTKGLLTVYDADSRQTIWTKAYNEPITSGFKTRTQHLWISTTEKVDILDERYRLIGGIPFSRQYFVENENGTVSTITGVRLAKYDQQGRFLNSNNLSKIYQVVLQLKSMTLAAGRSGLDRLDAQFQISDSFTQFENIKISCLLPLTDSTFLASTIGNGFFTVNYRSKKARQYNSDTGFIADNIYTVIKLDNAYWFGTDKGLARIEVDNLIADKVQFDHLTKSSGLLANKISHLAGSSSTLWVFTDEGITLVPTQGTRFAHQQPAFVLNRVAVNDEEMILGEDQTLSFDKNNLQFDIRCITFNNPAVKLRARVLNSEPWVYTDNLNLSYASLAPATYELNAQFSIDNINWFPVIRPIQFTIDQPWFMKWYFVSFAFLIFCGLGFLYIRYQRSIFRQKNHLLKIINEHQQKLIQSEIVALERERNRISKELHDRVGTNLTAIKLTVNQILQSHQDPHIHEVEEQFQIAIGEIKEIIYGLTPPSLERYGLFTSLRNYVGKLNKNIPISISLKTYGKEVGGSDLNIILFRVLQELLNNSIKHSFAKNITIHINSFDDVLNIVYEDDGIGFSYDPLQSGLGLDNIESRIHSLNGTLKFDSGKFGISYTIDIPITVNKEVV